MDGAFVLLGIFFIEHERRECRTAEAAAIGRLPDQDDVPARGVRGRGAVDDFGLFEDAERDHVHQAIVAKAVVKVDVARDSRYADRVAVRGDSVDDALCDVAAMRVVLRPEAQRIRKRDDARAHAEHVAHDTSDAGCGAFERHDLRGMVMGFVRDDDAVVLSVPNAEVDDAGVFLRSLHHRRAFGRQALQEVPRALIRTMFAPLCVECVDLDERRIASQPFGDATQLRDLQSDAVAPEFAFQFRVARAVHAQRGVCERSLSQGWSAAAADCSAASRLARLRSARSLARA